MENKFAQHITSKVSRGKLVIQTPKGKCLVSKKGKYLVEFGKSTAEKITIEGAAIAVKKFLDYGNLTQIESAIKSYGERK